MESSMQLLKDSCDKFDIELDGTAFKRFETYSKMIIDWNERINLTAITKPNEIAVKHFLDSMLLLKACNLGEGGTLLDVGTGAGFPGVPIKIAIPKVNITLLDSLNKRLVFLKEVVKELNIEAEIIHSRAEEGAKKPELRERFDVVTSRAVASLNLLAEYCLPYVKQGGVFIAMKGPQVDEQIKEAEHAIRILGGKIKEVKHFILPDESKRNLIVIEKITKTPSKYPRHGSKIAKKPL